MRRKKGLLFHLTALLLLAGCARQVTGPLAPPPEPFRLTLVEGNVSNATNATAEIKTWHTEMIPYKDSVLVGCELPVIVEGPAPDTFYTPPPPPPPPRESPRNMPTNRKLKKFMKSFGIKKKSLFIQPELSGS